MAMFQNFRLERRAFVIAALFCLGLLPIVLMMHHVRSNWVPIPFWDEWHTPASQFESWCRGRLTVDELFSQHNESRKFFPRLLYFALAIAGGGWDVRAEMAVLFFEVCLLSALLWRLLRQTSGSTPVTTLITWAIMMFLCFSPVQFENFLWGIQLEPFFIGLAVVAVATVNLSGLSFGRKTLINVLLAFVATYTFANGMVLWPLAFPLAASSDSTSRRHRILWSGIYVLTAIAAIGFYFNGYERPSYHPKLASLQHQGLDLAHYLILWIGSYFVSDRVNPLVAGITAIGLSAFLGTAMLVLVLRYKHWRSFYPWLLIGTYAVVTGIVTAFGRLGFGVQQALDGRYKVFSLFFYLALVGGGFAIYCTHIQTRSRARRAFFLVPATSLIALAGICWIWCYQKNLVLLQHHRELRVNLIGALEWIDVIPDNPDLALILPFVEVLKNRARFLAEHHVLRLPFVKGPLANQTRQSPSGADGSTGQIETCVFDSNGSLSITGWAWLPGKNQRADFVIVGCKNAAGDFKPISVLRTGARREDLRERFHIQKMAKAGFSQAVNPANLLPGDVTIEGWGIDFKAQKAWPLASSLHLRQSR
jgi:hypothetical protein